MDQGLNIAAVALLAIAALGVGHGSRYSLMALGLAFHIMTFVI